MNSMGVKGLVFEHSYDIINLYEKSYSADSGWRPGQKAVSSHHVSFETGGTDRREISAYRYTHKQLPALRPEGYICTDTI
jgi:hypothetical protein